jgi:hypothetical protein
MVSPQSESDIARRISQLYFDDQDNTEELEQKGDKWHEIRNSPLFTSSVLEIIRSGGGTIDNAFIN